MYIHLKHKLLTLDNFADREDSAKRILLGQMINSDWSEKGWFPLANSTKTARQSTDFY